MGFQVGIKSNYQIKIFQFINSSKVRDKNYINTILTYNAIICFDLEDSIKTAENNLNLQRLSIYNDILELIRNYKVLELGIRINSIHDIFFLDDILQISNFSGYKIHLNIFLPKVSTVTDLKKIITEIELYRIHSFEIIPIIESKLGMKNLNSIFTEDLTYISKIAFGHCDYNYDCNYFPFHHQDSEKYWEWINEISQSCGNEFTFLNSPYLNLKDDDYLFEILFRLKKVRNRFGQITLSLRQSEICNLFNHQEFQLSYRSKPTIDSGIASQYAMHLVSNYEKYRVEKKNFAIIPGIKKLISPQEYAKAKEMLRVNNEIKN